MKNGMFQRSLYLLCLLIPLFMLAACGDDDDEIEELVSSLSYKGHENDIDANNLVSVYPSIVGTRLDDCQTCHIGIMEDGQLAGSSCDNCHNLILHGTEGTATETLNSFGLAYLEAGRDMDALQDIDEEDSDGDGYGNGEEIINIRYPGSEMSQPGQEVAVLHKVYLDELKAMPSHTQFMLSNTTKQQFDDYAIYKGVTLKELFSNLGIDITGATGITAIAPDGYMKSLDIENVDKIFPQPEFYAGLDVDTLGADCGFVNYPEEIPDGLTDGSSISGEHWLMMGYERDGIPLDTSYLDAVEGRIVGSGPLRLVVPQNEPGKPDRGLKYSPTDCNDGYDFNDNADHNAGAMVRGVIAIRIDPMPAGVEEFDYMNGGWAYINSNQLIIYGHNVR